MSEQVRDQSLLAYLAAMPEWERVCSGAQGRWAQAVFGLPAGLRTLLMVMVASVTKRPQLIVMPSLAGAKQLVEELQAWQIGMPVRFFPAAEVMPYEVLASSHELLAQRMVVLQSLALGEAMVVVTTADALMKTLLPPAVLKQARWSLALGQQVELTEACRRLHELGYQRLPLVEAPGQYALRGGILDIFPLTETRPVRVEFFDDEIDSLRFFDVQSQRSLENATAYTVGPARELVLTAEGMTAGRERLAAEADRVYGKLLTAGEGEAAARLREKVDGYLEQLDQGIWTEGMEQYQQLFYPDRTSLFDYLSPETIVFMDEPSRLQETMRARSQEVTDMFTHLLAAGQLLPSQQALLMTEDALTGSLAGHSVIYLSLLPKRIDGVAAERAVSVAAKSMHAFMGKLEPLAEELQQARKRKLACLIIVSTPTRCQRLREALRDYGLETVVGDVQSPLLPGTVTLAVGTLEAGFELPAARLIVLTDAEIFGREKKPRKPKKSTKAGTKIDSFLDLNAGDYVVHVNHGIGRYLGVEKLEVGGIHKDYLVIRYAGEDRLYVPTDQVHLMQKYVGSEGVVPKIYKLGGNDWQKVKQKVKESVREMAGDLLQLYAQRENRPGHAFLADSPWQREFEERFPYEETPDQARSIDEVKGDMEKPKPMDRLLCGDVGYGKTEVAIRAAFKAVYEGFQVAILVPTTILAQQHYNTFRERFTGYAVTVEVLSRFRSAKEQKVTLEKLAKGSLDIVIGTHRLVSQDVRFKNLGLLIIDEEQRFGVAHKEKIKQLKQDVDVLTLSATPIPRTLHMSMVGLRDMSTIETPPDDRYPVQTYVVEHNPELIREAIKRELGRGGQVYYVRNRVEDLDRIARDLAKMVPDVRIGIGHGKMREDQLEQVMLDFIEGEYDILVCTTIIETGLDVPNVNTLIVDGADLMGLAQLYQLRGRVGRANRLAYAYFTYRKDKLLTEVAEKRLHAIREFTELGSGFKIAMRDLEIRGVGNLLGAEQHGHLASVGFDLYCRMLEEAVQDLRGEKTPEVQETLVEIAVDGFIPDDYVGDPALKVHFYKRLLAAKEPGQVNELEEELEDRFGDLPDPVLNLVRLSRVKANGLLCGVSAVQWQKEQLRIRFFPHSPVTAADLQQISHLRGRKVMFQAAGVMEMAVQVARVKAMNVLALADNILQDLGANVAGGAPQDSQTTEPQTPPQPLLLQGAPAPRAKPMPASGMRPEVPRS
ncbi:transcription-repair coupling factor [Heliophilum fasciatum]|uniref:Transcription-repair-coupling factor n=1 Tax=Heliophilum fasciatum TaxID=35700 RepID=A0A4R2RY53_9FIRM|nr:transcription-repair coupling factor [Heliophilum fasciatum]MCW2277026.1 transcription-repair coupling factor (superfamily II helicase) [Heliophilum fasciatum]TCP68448.1 transcription-repair coupling factor [Heliophilum fasciatum]